MKKIWLIAFLFNALNFVTAAENPISNFSAESSVNTSFTQKEGFSFTESFLFSTTFLQLKTLSDNNTTVSGIVFDYKKLIPSFPLRISIGNLENKGPASKINNPSLSSSISSFSSFSELTGFSVSLPGFSSFSKPLSFSASYDFSSKEYILQKLQLGLFYKIPEDSSETTFTFSALASIKPEKNLEFTFSQTAGIYSVQGSSSTSWYSETAYLPKNTELCSNFQYQFFFHPENNLHFQIKNLSSLNFYFIPDFLTAFTIENKSYVKLNHLELSGTLFYNGFDSLITPQKTLDSKIQIKSNLKYSFIGGIKSPSLFTLGSSFYTNSTLDLKTIDFKECIGIKTLSDKMTVQFQIASCQNLEENSFYLSSFNFSGKSSFIIKKIKSGLNLNFLLEPDRNFRNFSQTEKLSSSFYFQDFLKTSAQFSLNFQQDNWIFSKATLSAALSSTFTLKKISCTCKISAAFDFQ